MDKAMRYAYEVYRERSFSQAAKNLYVSQPALSLAIRKLESELGLPLFDRNTTPVSLTAEGRVYIDTVQQIMHLTEQLDSYMDDCRSLRAGRLTIGAPHLFIVHLLPSIIGQFAENYSQVDFSMLEGDTVQLREMLLNDEIDLILDTSEYEPDLLVQHCVLNETILLAVPSTHQANLGLTDYAVSLEDVCSGRFLEEQVPAVPLEHFKNERFLLQRKGQDMYDRAMALCAQAGFVPQSHLHLNQLVTALDLTRQSRGLTFVSDTSVKTLQSGDGLVFYKLDGEITHRKVYISYRKNRYVSLAMQKFIQLTAGHTAAR